MFRPAHDDHADVLAGAQPPIASGLRGVGIPEAGHPQAVARLANTRARAEELRAFELASDEAIGRMDPEG